MTDHRLIGVVYEGDRARYSCSCGAGGPWCRGAPVGAQDRRAPRSVDAEVLELFACHLALAGNSLGTAPGGGHCATAK